MKKMRTYEVEARVVSTINNSRLLLRSRPEQLARGYAAASRCAPASGVRGAYPGSLIFHSPSSETSSTVRGWEPVPESL